MSLEDAVAVGVPHVTWVQMKADGRYAVLWDYDPDGEHARITFENQDLDRKIRVPVEWFNVVSDD